jgi:hypothetical protein
MTARFIFRRSSAEPRSPTDWYRSRPDRPRDTAPRPTTGLKCIGSPCPAGSRATLENRLPHCPTPAGCDATVPTSRCVLVLEILPSPGRKTALVGQLFRAVRRSDHGNDPAGTQSIVRDFLVVPPLRMGPTGHVAKTLSISFQRFVQTVAVTLKGSLERFQHLIWTVSASTLLKIDDHLASRSGIY